MITLVRGNKAKPICNKAKPISNKAKLENFESQFTSQ